MSGGERLLHLGEMVLLRFLFREQRRAFPSGSIAQRLGGVAGLGEPRLEFGPQCGERRDFRAQGIAQPGERLLALIQLELQ